MGKVAAEQTVRRKLGIGSCNCRFELGFAVKFRSLFIVLRATAGQVGWAVPYGLKQVYRV